MSRNLSGIVFLLGSVLCWGSVPVFLRHLTGSIDAWTANGIRYPLAAILYWPVLVLAWRSGSLNRDVIRRCALPALLAFGGQIFWALAPYHLSASAIGFFVRLSLLWSLIGAMALFPDERRLLGLPQFHLGLICLLVGFLWLTIARIDADAGVTRLGIVLILLCSVFFGFYSVSVRHSLGGINPLLAFGVVAQCVSAGTLTAMLTAGRYEDMLTLGTSDWGILATSSVLGIALGHVFLYAAVKRLGAAVASGVQTLTPFVTILLASSFLGESMSAVQWCAGTTMVAGATLLLAAQQRLASHFFAERQQPV